MEQVVLGSIIADQYARPQDVLQYIPIEYFSDPINRRIYIEWLHNPLNLSVNVSKLGPEYVKRLGDICSSVFTVYSLYKDEIVSGVESVLVSRAIEDVQKSLEQLKSSTNLTWEKLHSVISSLLRGRGERFSSYLLRDILSMYQKKPLVTVAKVPYAKWGQYIDSFYSGDYWIIGARPSTGKTALSFDLAFRLALEQVPVYYLSLEMGRYALLERAIARVTKQSIADVRRSHANLDYDYLARKLDVPLYVNDVSTLDDEMLEIPFIDAAEKGCKVLTIDYIQLVKNSSRKERYAAVGEVSARLKEYAKKYNLSTIVLSQLNRMSEHRADKKPILADLRESGSLEQDADVVALLHRPCRYGIDTYDDGTPTENTLQVIIAKNRQGPIGEFILYYDPQYQLVEDYALWNTF